MKRFLLRATATIVAVLLLLASLEVMAIGYRYVTEGHYVSARESFASATNAFTEGLTAGRNCSYVDSIFPHPYLAFVHHGNPPCGIEINNIGLFGADFPAVHRQDRWVVLLTGGSVANQFAQAVQGGPSYLERMLNERYVSPSGKPFLVLNGADGAWKQPQQAILFMMFGDAVDAVVTLDGFNEHYALSWGYKFEYPASNFHLVNPLVSQSFGDVVARWIVANVRAAAARNAILSRSQAVYSLIAAADQYFTKRAASRPKAKTTVETLFSLPAEWTPQQRTELALMQYQKYVRAMSTLARDYGVREAHFIQPAPAIAKVLTDDERKVVGNLGYAAIYETMTKSLLELNAHHIPVISLLPLFESERRTVYSDAVHFVRNPDGTSEGYQAMAARMASELAAVWVLQRR